MESTQYIEVCAWICGVGAVARAWIACTRDKLDASSNDVHATDRRAAFTTARYDAARRDATQCACPGRFIIFFLFKCHFVACSAVYKTECVLSGSRVSYHLSSFVAYKHNSTRSLARFILFTYLSGTWERCRIVAKIALASSGWS